MAPAPIAAVLRSLAALLAPIVPLALLARSAPAAGPPIADDSCAPSGGLAFVCGAGQPEDLARIPGTPWVVVSGFSPGSGLKLLDTGTRALVRWSGEAGDEPRFDGNRDSARGRIRDHHGFDQCPGPPDAASMDVQGISLRAGAGGGLRLLASNHGAREAVEVFQVQPGDGGGQAMPRLHWVGCLPLPRGLAANAVSSFPDGTVLATVLTLPGRTMADYVLGRDTGVVLESLPGEGGFHVLPGTNLPGNNGLEAGSDNRRFYVVAFGRHAIVGFERGRRAHRILESVAPGFMPDNIHWDGDRLVAAGMQYDEPACGGLRKVVDGVAEAMTCHRGYSVALFDPRTGTWQLLAHGAPNPGFNGVSTGLRVDGTLWLGSYQADRLAYLPLATPASR